MYLYDIDNLPHVVVENRTARQREAALGEMLVAREVEHALRWLDEQEVVSAVVRLRRKAETIRTRELAKLFSRLAHLSDADRIAIGGMASSLVNKLLHTPIVRVKQESQSRGNTGYLQALRHLFSLDE